MGPEALEQEHKRAIETCLSQFHATRKMGGTEFSQQYAEKLEEEVMELYANFIKHNESKNIFAAARTPAVMFSVMVICYMLAGILGIIGLESLANLINLVMGSALVALCTWAYVRYSGDYREVGVTIDKMADFIWDMVRNSFSIPHLKTALST